MGVLFRIESGPYVSRSTPTWRHVRVPNFPMTMVARGAKRRATWRCGERLCAIWSLSLFLWWMKVVLWENVPMEIESPPTKAKLIGLAPGNVPEFK